MGTNISNFFPCKIGVCQRNNLLPLLFAIYLNDFNNFLSTKFDGLIELSQEVNRIHNIDEIETYLKLYTLLYADDTVILAESEKELQKALDALEIYCKLWQLHVNLDKTKIFIFSRGKVSKHITFLFGGNPVEVVPEYVYLGVVMNYNNKFSKAIQKQILLARKALFVLNAKILELDLPIDIQIKLFETLILPILTYGCEIWGFSDLNSIELFHRRFIKDCLKISKFASNSIACGESGLQNIENIIYTRMICFWNKFRQSQSNKLSFKMFKFIKLLYDRNIYHSKWCTKVCYILDSTGLSYVWNWEGISTYRLKRLLKQRLYDAFVQNWSSDMAENSLCTNYKIFKTEFRFENYLLTLDDDLRIPLTKYRCGSHYLPISEHRYNGVCDDHRCPLCLNDTGDEFHYIFICPAFDSYRTRFIDSHLYKRANALNFQKLFTSTSKEKLERLSKFVKVILHVFRP